MKRLSLLFLLLGIPSLPAQQNGIDQSLDLVTLPTGEKVIHWYGHTGRSYFVQASKADEPLKKWSWAPIIESGNDEEISHEVEGTPTKGFFRLKYTDQIPGPGETLDTEDFDNDGLSNLDEITATSPTDPQTDPLDNDTDGDLIPDGWELGHGLDPTNPADAGQPFGNGGWGVTNLEAWQAGVSSSPTATPVDRDGDGVPDTADTDPDDPNKFPPGISAVSAMVMGDGLSHDENGDWHNLTSIAWDGSVDYDELVQGLLQPQTLTEGLAEITMPQTPPAGQAGFWQLLDLPNARNLSAESCFWHDLVDPSLRSAYLTKTRLWIHAPSANYPREFHFLKTRTLLTNDVVTGVEAGPLVVTVPANQTVSAPVDLETAVHTAGDDNVYYSNVRLLPIEVKSPSARNSGLYDLSKHDPSLYPRPGNVLIPKAQQSLENALVLYFEDCTEADEIEARTSNHFDLSVGSGAPIELTGVNWEVIEKPPGSPDMSPNQPNYLIRLISNNDKNMRGGLYRFRLNGANTIEPQVWLPLAGPNITEYWQSEITYFKDTWGPAYREKILEETSYYTNEFMRSIVKKELAIHDMDELGGTLDWHGSPQGQYGPCGGPNKLGDELRLTISKIVVDFRKRNNMMYALIGREMEIPEIVLMNAADPAKNPFATGAPDSEQTKESYRAGFDLFDGVALATVMKNRGRKMQPPNSWSRREWPSWETTNETLVRSQAAKLQELIQ